MNYKMIVIDGIPVTLATSDEGDIIRVHHYHVESIENLREITKHIVSLGNYRWNITKSDDGMVVYEPKQESKPENDLPTVIQVASGNGFATRNSLRLKD